MSIAAINEQLLRAIGVGVVLVDRSTLEIGFHNDIFAEWFGIPVAGATLTDVFPEITVDALRAELADGGALRTEIGVRKNRRQLRIALKVNPARNTGGELLVAECQNITRIRELESMIDSYSTIVERNTRDLKREKERVEKLLLNMMPRPVYEEYKTFGVVTPQLYRPVTVLSLEIAGFSDMIDNTDPAVLIAELNDIYTSFDQIGEQIGCERIKTTGEDYLAIAGMPEPTADHARAAAGSAVRFVRYLKRRNETHPNKWNCRIGLATGAVVGSVVGVQKYFYDVFGPAVNIASRIRAHSEPMEIILHEPAAQALESAFPLSPRGRREIRGYGEQELLVLNDFE